MAGVTGTRQELAGPLQHSPSSSPTDKDKGPEAQRGHEAGLRPSPQVLLGAPPTPSPGFPLESRKWVSGSLGVPLTLCWEGLGAPLP